MQSGRFELPIANRGDFFEIAPASDNGLFLHRHFSSSSKDDQLQLVKLDTAFQEKWGGFIAVEKNYRIMGTKAFDQKLFMFLRYKDYSKNDLILFVIHESDGTYVKYPVKSYIPFAPTEFQITKDAALIGGYYNRIPVVLHFSLWI